jgi:glucose/mannose-6-phosphate isomerase
MPMNLDDIDQINTLDHDQMISKISALPEQIIEAWDAGKSICLPEIKDITQVYLCGVGSTFIAARLLQSFLSQSCTLPIHAVCDFDLPAWAKNNQTLLILSGYDGNEIELRKIFSSGLEIGCRIIVVAKGGFLMELAHDSGIPFVRYDHAGPARTALAKEFFLPLAILEKTGAIPVQNVEISSTAELLFQTINQINLEIPIVKNPAKRMAGQFLNRWITLLASGFMEVIADRWKSQIHENAKAWAQVESIPRICHSTMGGIYYPENQLTQMMTLFLQSPCDEPENLAISDEARKMFMVEGFNTDFYLTQGTTVLECMWNAILFGDFISYYLALAYDIDPTPVPGVEEIEAFLSQE